ncbi:MAG: hypothetical protein Q9170_007445 [Blastenia crenularia]
MYIGDNNSKIRAITAVAALLAPYRQLSAAMLLESRMHGARQALSEAHIVEATFTDVFHKDPNSHLIDSFPSDCLTTARNFFNIPMVSHIPFRWKRVPPGRLPGPGANFLPFTDAQTSCMFTLEALNDPNAEDQFAIQDIADDFRTLFNKCIRGRTRGPSAGFIPVGPRKVLKLSIGPVDSFRKSSGH